MSEKLMMLRLAGHQMLPMGLPRLPVRYPGNFFTTQRGMWVIEYVI